MRLRFRSFSLLASPKWRNGGLFLYYWKWWYHLFGLKATHTNKHTCEHFPSIFELFVVNTLEIWIFRFSIQKLKHSIRFVLDPHKRAINGNRNRNRKWLDGCWRSVQLVEISISISRTQKNRPKAVQKMNEICRKHFKNTLCIRFWEFVEQLIRYAAQKRNVFIAQTVKDWKYHFKCQRKSLQIH